MGAENNVPGIRFKGFGGEWVEERIGNVLAEVRRPIELLDKELYQLVTVKRRNEGVMPRSLLKGSDILVKTYFVINAGDCLISKRQVVHGANGIVPKSLDNAVVSNEYLVVTDNENITTNFWTVISKRSEMHKMFFISSYGVDIEKLVFDVNDWKQRTFVIPKLTEQNRITDYFQHLDTLITQHQQKHDKLLNIKKALLEKMFPKQGATEPEIRFKGFSGEWEKKELIDVAKYRNGKAHENNIDEKGKYIVVNSKFVSTNGEIKKFSNEQIEPLLKNEIAFVLSDVPNGRAIARTFLVKENIRYTLNQRIAGITLTESNSPYYLHILLNRNPYFLKFDDGVKQTNLTKNDVESFTDYYPDGNEQTKIGNLFKQLDTLITQHQAQLKKLNNIKQACLEKMFV